MTDKVIFPENLEGRVKTSLIKLMNMAPAKDRDDEHLKRLIVFRLKLDGEAKTMKYLKYHLEEARKSKYEGSIYDFIINEKNSADSGHPELNLLISPPKPKDDPPDEIG